MTHAAKSVSGSSFNFVFHVQRAKARIAPFRNPQLETTETAMTPLKSLLGTILFALPLLTSLGCGDDQAHRGQTLPTDDEALVDAPAMDFAINRPTINRMWGSGDKDIWGVGQGAMSVHWDGKVWRRIAVPTGSNLLSVWGSSSTDVWAVGEGGTMLHWDGTRWSRVTTPAPDSAALNDIWGVSASNVWAVGDNGVVLRYDGSSWAMVPIPSINNLLTVWAVSSTDAWIGGDLGMLLRWDGSTWNEMQSNGATPIVHIRGVSSTKVWLAKNNYEIQLWDGTKWTRASSMYGSRLWVNSENDYWVWGNSNDVYHWNGLSLQFWNLSYDPTSIWGNSNTNAWSFAGTEIYYWNGTSFDYRW
jgi:hypothetical protein